MGKPFEYAEDYSTEQQSEARIASQLREIREEAELEDARLNDEPVLDLRTQNAHRGGNPLPLDRIIIR